jgi:hypothetical protein
MRKNIGRSVITTRDVSLPGSGFATCPSCHTTDTAVTNDALSKGSDWECARCGGQWNATRLATVAAYALWLSGRNNAA